MPSKAAALLAEYEAWARRSGVLPGSELIKRVMPSVGSTTGSKIERSE